MKPAIWTLTVLTALVCLVCGSAPCIGQNCYYSLECSSCNCTGGGGFYTCTQGKGCTPPDCHDGACDSTPSCAGCTQVCGGKIETTTICCTRCPQGPSAAARPCGAAQLVPTGLVLISGQIQEGSDPFQLLISPDIPLEMTSSHTETNRFGTTLEYNLLNGGDRPIVAINVRWTTYIDGQPAITSNSIVDYWIGGRTGWFQPHQDLKFSESSGRVFGKGGLTKIEGVVTYVEFADGSTLGEDAASISAQRAAYRAAFQAECRKVLAAYRHGGETGLMAEALRARASKQSAAREAGILARYKTTGPGGLASELSDLKRIVSLPIPGASAAR